MIEFNLGTGTKGKFNDNLPKVYTTQQEQAKALSNKGTPTQNFDYYKNSLINLDENLDSINSLMRGGETGFFRFRTSEMEDLLKKEIFPQIITNTEIMNKQGCQTIEGYVCDADCNQIAIASSNCLPNYKYKPIKPSYVAKTIFDGIVNGIQKDKEYFILKCKKYIALGWKVQAYASPGTLNFYIKFTKLRDELDIIDESVPSIAVFANLQTPLPRFDILGDQNQLITFDPIQNMIENLKAQFPNKTFILKYHWDQKENICKALGIPLNVTPDSLSLATSEEIMASIDGYYSAQAPIYRYAPILGVEQEIPDFNFNNTKGTNPNAIGTTRTEPNRFLSGFSSMMEGLDSYLGYGAVSEGLQTLSKLNPDTTTKTTSQKY